MSFDAGYLRYAGPKSQCDFCEEIFRSGDSVIFVELIGYIFCATVDITGRDCSDKWSREHKIRIDKSAVHFRIFCKEGRRPTSEDDYLIG